MNAYFGALKKYESFTNENVVQNTSSAIGTIGYWFTADFNSAKPYAIGKETVFEKSEMEFWEDGEPKVIQKEKPVIGYIYKVYINEPDLKLYRSTTETSYELFMNERDKYCDYYSAKQKNITWKDNAVLLNKDEANAKFRKNLIRQSYEGLLIPNCNLETGVTDLCCLFSLNSVQISDILPVDNLN